MRSSPAGRGSRAGWRPHATGGSPRSRRAVRSRSGGPQRGRTRPTYRPGPWFRRGPAVRPLNAVTSRASGWRHATPGLLTAAVAEIEDHVHAAGWDRGRRCSRSCGPAASPPTTRRRPPAWASTASPTGRADPDRAGGVPDGALDEVLAGIAWPDVVDGCAVTQEIVILPPAAEADLTAPTTRRAPRHTRTAARRASSSACCATAASAALLRLRGGRGRPAHRSRARPEPRRGAARRCACGRPQQWGTGLPCWISAVAAPRCAACRPSPRCSPDGMALRTSPQLPAGARKTVAPLLARGDHLQRDAADRADLAGGVDGAGAGDEPARR